jgi:hypothetical protein
LVFVSRGLVYVGMFFLTLLRFKVTHGLNVSDAFFALGAILLLLSRRPPKPAPKTPAWYVGSFIFLLAGVIASTQADSKGGSLLVVGNAIYLFFVLQYLLRQHLGRPVYMQRAVIAFVSGVTLSAFVAIMQVEFHVLLYKAVTTNSGSIGGNSRAVGLSTQPNLAGISFALGIVLATGLLSYLGVRRHGYLVGCIAVMAAALLLSGSVSGMGSTIVGLIVLFIARGFSLRTIVSVVVALAVVYVLVFGVIDRGSHLDPITRIEKTTNAKAGAGGGTLSLRIDTIKLAWDDITEKPILGHGLDQQTLAVYYDQSLYVYYPPHDLFALYWFGGGIFMVVALLIMMGSAFNRLLNDRRRRGKGRDPMRDVVLATCVTVLFFALQGPELVDRWFWLPFLLAMCFRDDLVEPPLAQTALALPAVAPNGSGAVTANGASGQPRRVSGKVGQHAAPGNGSAVPAPDRGRHSAPSSQ